MQNEKRNPTDKFPPVTLSEWREQVKKDLKGGDIERLSSRTLDGFTIQPLYTLEMLPGTGDFAGLPGLPPFRRGSHALGRSGRRWQMRQRYRHPDPQRVAQEIRDDLDRGATSLWLCFNRAMRLGDETPDDDGVLCPDLGTLSRMLASVDLTQHALSLDVGANALPVAAQWFALAEQQGVPLPKLAGALNCDPLAGLSRDGALPYSLDRAFAHQAALAHFCVHRAPRVRAIGSSTLPYHEAGATAAQEIGLALATAVQYLRVLGEAGLSVDDTATQLQFTVAIGSDFFMEIAKLRALRQAWAFVIAQAGGHEEAQRAVIQTLTSPFTKSRLDPYVNMLRVTTEAFAAAVGGADAICTTSFDSAFGVEEAFGRRIASNAQVVLNEESHVAKVADPAGGAYFVENLTDELAQAGYRVFQEIERMGGQAAALRSGQIKALIADKAAARRQDLRTRKLAMTGVSEFANLAEEPLARPAPDLAGLAARLSISTPSDHLPTIDQANQGADLVVAVMAATTAGAAVRGISAVLRGAEPAARCSPLSADRKAADYETLRDRSTAHAAKTGARPHAFLCNLGAIVEHKARSSFAAGFLQAGGISCLDNDGFADVGAAVAAYGDAHTPLVVLCGSDAQYGEWAPRLVPALVAAGAALIVLAGKPGASEPQYRDLGVTDFIYMGADLIATLTELFARLGVE